MKWSEFEQAAPTLAAMGRARLDAHGLGMLGTVRRDGWPRVTPNEYSIMDGELLIGGMWQSKKMLDLERDGRCAYHSVTTDKSGTEGDFKLTGRVIPQPPEVFETYGRFLLETEGFEPEQPYHLFALDIVAAAFVQFGPPAAATAERLRGDANVRVTFYPADGGPGEHVVALWEA